MAHRKRLPDPEESLGNQATEQALRWQAEYPTRGHHVPRHLSSAPLSPADAVAVADFRARNLLNRDTRAGAATAATPDRSRDPATSDDSGPGGTRTTVPPRRWNAWTSAVRNSAGAAATRCARAMGLLSRPSGGSGTAARVRSIPGRSITSVRYAVASRAARTR